MTNLLPANLTNKEMIPMHVGKAIDLMNARIPSSDPFKNFYIHFASADHRPPEWEASRKKMERHMRVPNAISKAFRDHSRRMRNAPTAQQLRDGIEMRLEGQHALVKAAIDPKDQLAGRGTIAKAQLDVGSLTNLANVTGGQTLGYISLDTHLARGTTRPNSFTLYQCLHKSSAYQIVDYWPYVFDTGGGLPGTSFQGFTNVSSGTLSTSAGDYELQYINLKLAVNGRAITTALAAQNSFVDIAAQENVNAALTVLESVNYACYYGNSTLFPNQFNGIGVQLPSGNVFNFQTFYNTYASQQSWSNAQTLFNLIYEAAAQITGYRNFGRITHAFMSPTTAGALQGLVTTTINNIATTLTSFQDQGRGIVVDGDLQGMRTRFGEIQFPIDLYISSRNKPAQAIVLENGTNFATSANPTPVSGVTYNVISAAAVAASAIPSVSQWTATYAATATSAAVSGAYSYAVAGCDANSNESTLSYILSNGPLSGFVASGIAVNGAYQITWSGAADNSAFRVYRSGLGYAPTSTGTVNPAAYRHIATLAVSGTVTSLQTFLDLNAKIPGSEDIFLLDLDESDNALDFRYLLPLTKVELFAQNLFMPWAVCMIGGVRLRIPKFHGAINNFVPDQPSFNPLQANPNAS